MTKEELEELRNENRQKLVDVYHKTAQFYEKFSDESMYVNYLQSLDCRFCSA